MTVAFVVVVVVVVVVLVVLVVSSSSLLSPLLVVGCYWLWVGAGDRCFPSFRGSLNFAYLNI